MNDKHEIIKIEIELDAWTDHFSRQKYEDMVIRELKQAIEKMCADTDDMMSLLRLKSIEARGGPEVAGPIVFVYGQKVLMFRDQAALDAWRAENRQNVMTQTHVFTHPCDLVGWVQKAEEVIQR